MSTALALRPIEMAGVRHQGDPSFFLMTRHYACCPGDTPQDGKYGEGKNTAMTVKPDGEINSGLQAALALKPK